MTNHYGEELTRAMTWLGEQEGTLFLGQAVAYPGTSQTETLRGVVLERRIELPVAEDMQMGMCIGLAVGGFVPVSIYPRWPFLLLATNQLVNHLDRLSIYSDGGYKPKVIIRVGIPTRAPMDPQAQHLGDYTEAFRSMLKTVEVIDCHEEQMIFPAYRKAYERMDGRSTLIVEHTQRFA